MTCFRSHTRHYNNKADEPSWDGDTGDVGGRANRYRTKNTARAEKPPGRGDEGRPAHTAAASKRVVTALTPPQPRRVPPQRKSPSDATASRRANAASWLRDKGQSRNSCRDRLHGAFVKFTDAGPRSELKLRILWFSATRGDSQQVGSFLTVYC